MNQEAENLIGQISQKYQDFLLPLAAVVVGLLLSALVVVPQVLRIPPTNTQIENAKNSLVFIDQKIATLDRKVNAATFKERLDTSYEALPTDPDIPKIFSQLINILGSQQLVLEDITFSTGQVGGNPQQAGAADTLNIRLTVAGSREQLESFINNAKRIPRITKVAAVAAVGTGTTLYEITLTLNNYSASVPTEGKISDQAPLALPDEKDLQTLERIKTSVDSYNSQFQSTVSASVQMKQGDPFQ